MNVTGVDFVAVPTRDYENADEFYGEVLGLARSKRWGDMPAGASASWPRSPTRTAMR